MYIHYNDTKLLFFSSKFSQCTITEHKILCGPLQIFFMGSVTQICEVIFSVKIMEYKICNNTILVVIMFLDIFLSFFFCIEYDIRVEKSVL